MNKFIIILFITTALIIILLIIKNKTIDNFNNQYSNKDIYTNDKCCNEIQKQNCMKYGKTGVCNYKKNNKSCLCQNAYT
jgi:hypothetical protein